MQHLKWGGGRAGREATRQGNVYFTWNMSEEPISLKQISFYRNSVNNKGGMIEEKPFALFISKAPKRFRCHNVQCTANQV